MNEMTMRPRSIAIFEQLYLVAIAMEVADIMLDFASSRSQPSQLWVRIAAVAASLVLVLLASRQRRRAAGIVLAALFVIGLPMIAAALGANVPLEASALILVQVILQLVALVFLFRPQSREWLAGPRAHADI